MTLLIVGIVVMIGIHLVPTFPDVRERLDPKNIRKLERRPASAAERPAVLPGRPREGACGKFLHCKIPIYLS